MTIEFRSHHAALSVRDLRASRTFYEWFGFREVATWSAGDGRLVIQHLALPDGFVLELFAFASARSAEQVPTEVGNDLPVPGVKHVGLRVEDVREARKSLVEAGFEGVTEVRRGRHPVEYCFVPDPDGHWLELVQDERVLDPRAPMRLSGD